MKLTFLGTGTSHGVPQIDCMLSDHSRCMEEICQDNHGDPRHHRTRSSLLIENGAGNILIDTSMDFRFQMLRSKVMRIDAVLFTHCHADHIYGLPDIRSYSFHQKKAIPIYGSDETIEVLKKSFAFIFQPPELKGGGIAEVTPHKVNRTFSLLGLPVTPIPVLHGNLQGCYGYRVGDIAYIPDVKEIPPSSLEQLKDLDVLIIDALRHTPHPTHLSLEESMAIADQLHPKRCFFTHMTHNIHYQKEEAKLPANYRFSYDTLQIDTP